MRKVRATVEFAVGTLHETGMSGFKQDWITGQAQGGSIVFTLSCGAGLGNPDMQASGAASDGRTLYARTDIRKLAEQIWAALEHDLRQAGEPADIEGNEHDDTGTG